MRAVNLLPREEPKRQRKRMSLGMQLALVAPFVLGSLLGAGYLMTSSKVNDERATLRALQDELATLPPPEAAPPGNAELAAQRNQRIAALGTALQARIAWDRILREISSLLPEDVWLTSLNAQSPGAVAAPAPVPSDQPAPTTTLGGATPPPVAAPAPSTSAPLNIAGFTYSQEGVARLMSRLAVIPELTDVKLVQSSQTAVSGRAVVQFSIQAGIRPQVAS
jgi:Tfp pilus assembly protein PilN